MSLYRVKTGVNKESGHFDTERRTEHRHGVVDPTPHGSTLFDISVPRVRVKGRKLLV